MEAGTPRKYLHKCSLLSQLGLAIASSCIMPATCSSVDGIHAPGLFSHPTPCVTLLLYKGSQDAFVECCATLTILP